MYLHIIDQQCSHISKRDSNMHLYEILVEYLPTKQTLIGK